MGTADSQLAQSQEAKRKTHCAFETLRTRRADMDPRISMQPSRTECCRIKQAGHTKALDPTLGIGQEKPSWRRGTHECTELSVVE